MYEFLFAAAVEFAQFDHAGFVIGRLDLNADGLALLALYFQGE